MKEETMSKTPTTYAQTLVILVAAAVVVHYLSPLDWPWAIAAGAAVSVAARGLLPAARRALTFLRLRAHRESTRSRLAAGLLIAALVAGPLSTHVYWMLGGTWGLYTDGVRDHVASTGVRIVAAVVVVLLVGAVLVVLARVGLWQQRFVPERMIRLFAWALAGVFLLETLAGFTWGRGEPHWLLYAPVSLVIAALALVVAGSGGASPRVHRHRTLSSP
jgi:uncharacterized protein DUF3995